MTLDFLCSDKIEFGKKIDIPKGSNYYIRKSKTRSSKTSRNPRVNFFKVNPHPTQKMKEIPKNAKYISFNLEGNSFHIEYGSPCFYDINQNKIILKRSDE